MLGDNCNCPAGIDRILHRPSCPDFTIPNIREELEAIAPKLFRNFPPWKGGISCDKGWDNLLKELSKDLEELLQYLLDEGCPGENLPYVGQVKEKLGGLRFYIFSNGGERYPSWPLISNRVNQAEGASEYICEKCGEAGEIREERPWIRTLCDTCFEPPKEPPF